MSQLESLVMRSLEKSRDARYATAAEFVGDLRRALLERVRQFPGQERKVYDYYRNKPQLLAELRAPIFEDKAVDYVLELAKVTDTKVTPEELYADPDADHDHDQRQTAETGQGKRQGAIDIALPDDLLAAMRADAAAITAAISPALSARSGLNRSTMHRRASILRPLNSI